MHVSYNFSQKIHAFIINDNWMKFFCAIKFVVYQQQQVLFLVQDCNSVFTYKVIH